ncbi:phosphonate C-P lyase system protein PhnH [Williamsia sterculiae]|uniref:Alpha-D-ribose 1-methylphosphonate 5-triphosphate synthase subunit PhnH n=1 Tax=Williamsia sterculiae TaxID=1344003 RepID=A0A1N7FJL4_9NOCA|nr:phosphonate C-P lyase system protein PhnH [Williamsia sterculiae]SIS00480.1 alpha-D-ribose 1-methylphosphonate 5-triphosphate synthase subunit PhnH [Williamsia sterculiae]
MITRGGADAHTAPGFADPTRDAQQVFRAVLDAMAHPARPYPVSAHTLAPEPLGDTMGAVALTLLDEETRVWLGGPLAGEPAVAAWLAFHTGARRRDDPDEGAFVLTTPAGIPDLDALAQGTEEAPHTSATVVLDVRGCTGAVRLRATGPGIDGAVEMDAPWADDTLVGRWRANTHLFPRGVDIVVVDDGGVLGLPRTTTLTAIDAEGY